MPGKVKEFLKVSRTEENMNTKFNMAVSSISGGRINKDSKWGKAAIYMFGFWTIATCFVCFRKADFLNLTIGIMGLYLLLDPQ